MKLYIFYWIKVSSNMRFAASFIDLFIAIQYTVIRKSLRTSSVSLHIYVYATLYVTVMKKETLLTRQHVDKSPHEEKKAKE